MSLNDLRRNWDGLGRSDPLWAILAYPERHGRGWESAQHEFFDTGRAAIDDLFSTLDRLGLRPSPLTRALDFGCGAGRLSLGLARYAASVDGVDVARSMVELARQKNVYPDRVHYHLNEAPHLRLFDDAEFDLAVSLLVLQHIPNTLKKGYMTELVRVLRPGGVAAFTVPSHADLSVEGLARRVPNSWQNVYRRRRYGYDSVMEFHPLRRRKVESTIAAAGGRVLHVEREYMAGPRFTSYLYIVGKPVAPVA